MTARDGVSVGAATFAAMDFVGAVVPTAMGLRVGAALFVAMIGVWDFAGAATFAATEIWSRCVTPLLPKKTC